MKKVEQELDDDLLNLYKKYKEYTENMVGEGEKEDYEIVKGFVFDMEQRIFDLLKIETVGDKVIKKSVMKNAKRR
jgi:hypothetical protein